MAEGGRRAFIGCLSSLITCCCLLVVARADWLNHGRDLCNDRFAKHEEKISRSSVTSLRLKWKFITGKDVTATPAISDGIVYFPSWNGNIYAVHAESGSLVWEKSLDELTGLNATGFVAKVNVTVSRATPTVADDLLIIGIYGPAVVIAVERATGNLVWSTQLDNRNSSLIAMSGAAYNRAFFVGTSSLEEELSVEECCTFQGSMAKLDIRTGEIIWQTFMLPDNGGRRDGYSGAAVWGSSPPIDVERNLIYIGTGNLYTAPPDIEACQAKQDNMSVPDFPDPCIKPENHENSIIALDIDSGEMRWFRELGGYDAWFLACNGPNPAPNCPPGPNPDADFGEAPMLLTITNANGTQQDIVAAVQKNGIAWALDRDNGAIVWSTAAGPGGILGGGTWGASTDGRKVYTNIVNNAGMNFTLVPSGKVTTGGGWVAMDADTGKILWSTGNPTNDTSNGPVTVANGVLFAGSTNGKGPIYAMDVQTGEILWSYETGATVYGGMSVSDGCVYVGNGYAVNIGASFPQWTSGTTVFAFCIQ